MTQTVFIEIILFVCLQRGSWQLLLGPFPTFGAHVHVPGSHDRSRFCPSTGRLWGQMEIQRLCSAVSGESDQVGHSLRPLSLPFIWRWFAFDSVRTVTPMRSDPRFWLSTKSISASSTHCPSRTWSPFRISRPVPWKIGVSLLTGTLTYFINFFKCFNLNFVCRETALLYDEKISSVGNKQRVATVVAHELAHQWFGNLGNTRYLFDLTVKKSVALGTKRAATNWRKLDSFALTFE